MLQKYYKLSKCEKNIYKREVLLYKYSVKSKEKKMITYEPFRVYVAAKNIKKKRGNIK